VLFKSNNAALEPNEKNLSNNVFKIISLEPVKPLKN
jgi:hypothetical protein